MNSPAGQREKMLNDYGSSLQDKIKKCDKNKDYLQKKYDNWVVSVDPNINDPLNRHRTAADTTYSSKSTQFNFWFFNSSSGQAQTFYHEFRHLMEENHNLDNSGYLGSRLSGNGTNEPIEIDADKWATSFIGGDCGC